MKALHRTVAGFAIATVFLFMLAPGPADAQFQPDVRILGPSEDQLAEGKSYEIRWTSSGLRSISIVAAGERTSFAGNHRGSFNAVIAEGDPAMRRSAAWTVPFLDTVEFRITVKGYNDLGVMVASDERTYLFRPEVLRTRTADGIYIDVRGEVNQRLYVLRDNKLMKAYLTSGSRTGEFHPRNVHPKKAHDHVGVFRIMNKYPVWHSRLFDVDMYWAMRYWNGHFIHGTYPNQYDKLGTPASSGCNRLTKEQAKELYDITPIGTRVEIIAE